VPSYRPRSREEAAMMRRMTVGERKDYIDDQLARRGTGRTRYTRYEQERRMEVEEFLHRRGDVPRFESLPASDPLGKERGQLEYANVETLPDGTVVTGEVLTDDHGVTSGRGDMVQHRGFFGEREMSAAERRALARVEASRRARARGEGVSQHLAAMSLGMAGISARVDDMVYGPSSRGGVDVAAMYRAKQAEWDAGRERAMLEAHARNPTPRVIDAHQLSRSTSLLTRVGVGGAWSRRRPSLGENERWIDRSTVFGNPYRVGEPMTITHARILGRKFERFSDLGGVRLSREDVIGLYRHWLWDRLREDPDFLEPLVGSDLVCWCADEDCHGHVLARALEWRYGGKHPLSSARLGERLGEAVAIEGTVVRE
jgi:hypothetical protein